MPTYTYRCVKCSKQEDVVHSINHVYNDLCVCGGEMRKVFYSASVSFKGSGFYSTDNRSK